MLNNDFLTPKCTYALCMLAILCSGIQCAYPQDKSPYVPEIHGTVRAKYEYEPQINSGRFEVRNARVSVDGKILPIISYKAEIDLSDEGKIKMLDTYVRFSPEKINASVTLGQMRVPFTIDAHRSPHLQYFANRSFIAKQVGNVRDVGLAASYQFGREVPVTLEGGIFNGSGLTNQKNYWTKHYNFSIKASASLFKHIVVETSAQKTRPDGIGIMMWDAGAYYHDSRWHIEGEYLRKNYSHGAFPGVNAVDAFVCRRFPLKKYLTGISVMGRYDYMSDHSNGTKGDNGLLYVNDPGRHRMTLGTTLHLGGKKVYADLRLNYEKYFYSDGVTAGISDRDKFVVELMCRF